MSTGPVKINVRCHTVHRREFPSIVRKERDALRQEVAQLKAIAEKNGKRIAELEALNVKRNGQLEESIGRERKLEARIKENLEQVRRVVSKDDVADGGWIQVYDAWYRYEPETDVEKLCLLKCLDMYTPNDRSNP